MISIRFKLLNLILQSDILKGVRIKCRPDKMLIVDNIIIHRKGIFWLAPLEFIANRLAKLRGIASITREKRGAVCNAVEFIEPYRCEVNLQLESWAQLVGFAISGIYF